MNLKFSVIVPVHNAEKYIDELMSSIIPQVEKSEDEAEVLLIENGSEDVTPAICDRYAEEYVFVKTLHFGRTGAYGARREGMKAAIGDYLIFADADDALAEDALEELSRYLNFFNERGKKPEVILYNAAAYETRDKRMFDFPFEENKVYHDKAPFYELMQKNDSLNALWNKTFSAALAERLLEDGGEGEGDESLNHGEDLLQTAEILDKAESIAYLGSILYYYRENGNGLTGAYHKDALDNQVRAWSVFDRYAHKWSGDTFKTVISERKTLTCCIQVAKLIYSGLSGAEKKRDLLELLQHPFYLEYARGPLPVWAGEESLFVHDLMKAENPVKDLLASGRSYRFRQTVKKLLRRTKTSQAE